jgi:GNAT superfamily N-acetyltransferase
MTLSIATLTGADFEAALPDIARLRITVFRDWPYLYDGTEEYEAWYLRSLAASEGHVVVVCRDGDRIVGAATGAPLASQHAEFSEPFRKIGEDPADWFYCAESVLLPEYRGQGVGHAFFEEREAHARKLGLANSTFCGVIRPGDHPMRPDDYRPLDAFWRKRGYERMDGVTTTFPWKDVGQPEETAKTMQFWARCNIGG